MCTGLGKALAGQGCTGGSLSGTRGPGLVTPLRRVAGGARKRPCCRRRALGAVRAAPVSTWCIARLHVLCWERLGWRRAVRRERGGKARDRERGSAPRQSTAARGHPSPLPAWQRGEASPRPPTRRGSAHPSAAGPAAACSRCPAAWLPGCGAGCPPGSGGPGQEGRRSAAGTGPGAGTGLTAATAGARGAVRRPPSSRTLGEGLRRSTERLSCEDEGVPLFIRGVGAPASPSALAR